MRSTVAVAVASLLVGVSAADNARASMRLPTNIPREDLDAALQVLAKNYDVQLIYFSGSVNSVQTQGAVGEFSADEAFARVLAGTGLTYRYLSDKAVTIVPVGGSGKGSEGAGSRSLSLQEGGDHPVFDQLRLAQADTSRVDSGAVADGSTVQNYAQLDEVLVTAQKTGVAERLQDVPVPISVISAEALMQGNKNQLSDYFAQIPGLSVAQGQINATIVSIRGITTGVANSPTVGYTLDDVPLGASTAHGSQNQVPIISPADIEQVEVLRGPQGTLYGDNSMGGLIRYVTVDPSTDRVFGDVRVGSDGVVGGTHLGYDTSAAVNFPLTDTLAIRFSAFTRLDPGYIDNVETGQRGINTSKSGGGRIAAKWTPSSDFSLKFSALYEKTNTYGDSGADIPTIGFPHTLGLDDLQQYEFRGAGYADQEWKNTSLTLNANLGGVKITTVSGYTVNGYNSIQDWTWSGHGSSPSLGVPLLYSNSVHKFTQEIRLNGTIGSHLEWLLGGFYTQEDNTFIQIVSETNPTSGEIIGLPGSVFYNGGPSRFREYAGFGALTWKIADRFDIQFGGRESRLSNPALDKGSFDGGSLIGKPPGPSTYGPPSDTFYRASAFTYVVSPRFKPLPNVMVYGRVSNGFRPGSGTSNPPSNSSCLLLHEPCQVNPDKITDYEVGLKAEIFNHVLSIDSSMYYINWKDIQVRLSQDDRNFNGNGSGAKSQGADLSLIWKPFESLTVSTWGAWNQAALTQPFAYAAAGQVLPYTARFSSNLSVEKDVLISGNAEAFFAGKEIYMGERLGEFTNLGAPRQILPAYSQTDLNAGIRTKPWTFNVYINNVTDRRGIVYGGLNSAAPFEFYYINPRTVGISLQRSF